MPYHTIFRDEWSGNASYRGHKIVDVSLKDLKPLSQEQIAAMAKTRENSGWMGWKYIQNTGKPGAEVSYATLFPTSGTTKEARMGTGEVEWHRLTWEQNPPQHQIVNALEELPIIEYRAAMIMNGSSDLAVAQQPVRPLR